MSPAQHRSSADGTAESVAPSNSPFNESPISASHTRIIPDFTSAKVGRRRPTLPIVGLLRTQPVRG